MKSKSTFVGCEPSQIVEALVGLKDVRVLAYRRIGPDVELVIEQTAVAETLAVVRVQPGETLAALAARVSPQLSTDQAVARIRDLNMLESAPLQAGQTLIAPIG
ncbi:LysM peptidoglycan-binding domain-containing protein [Mycolicibacterium insubricum]|nr:LysM peptidoglycan-binding domain-containing protein [Mycolicibacterium insubricum]